MKEIAISASIRTEAGKGFARRTRMAGNIPAIVYGPEIDPISVAVNERTFRALMKNATSSSIINLKVDGKENKVILRDIQRDPVTSRVIHMDFHAISMNRPINVFLPITFVGIPIGVRQDGGIMQSTMRELSISCLPADIPDSFEVNVEELGIGDSIHLGDIEIPNVELLDEARRTVVVISAPTVVVEPETEEEAEGEEGELAEGEEAAAEGAEGAEGEAAKPDEGEKKK